MTKTDILEATLALACEKGLGSVSMSQIADRVNLKKSSLYSHFSSKEEIIESMYAYFREKARMQSSSTETDYGRLAEGRSLKEILTLAVEGYRAMNSSSQLHQFYRLIVSERAVQPAAAQIMVEETTRMITATKNLFYAAAAKGAARFENPDSAALIFAMGVHALLDFEYDAQYAGTAAASGAMEQFLEEFCSCYAADSSKGGAEA